MAEIRCPNCGKNNPDFLDVCQFCQTPLKPDSVLRIGQTPTKKDTGELEAVLPDWLKNVRQQARDSAEEEATHEVDQPKVEKNETPDFLAGLVSQSSDMGDEEIPDWLASINPVAGSKPAAPSTPAPPPEADFFAQFNQSEAKAASQPEQKKAPVSPQPALDQPPASTEEDDLSKWFAKAAEEPEEVVEVDSEAGHPEEPAWSKNFESAQPPQQEPSAPKEQEDLSWLHNLEDVAKQTGDLQAPKQGTDWMANFEAPSTPSEPSSTQEDLSWLDTLGGIEASAGPAPAQPSAEGEDLSWLNSLGGASEPQPFNAAPDKPISTPPFTSEEDLSWLKDLGGTPVPTQPTEAAPSSSPQEDLSWLNDLGGGSGSQFTPPFTEPEAAPNAPFQMAPGQKEEMQPDWLKNALNEPATPASGDATLDWFAGQDETIEEKPAPSAGAPPASQTPQPAPFADVFSAPSEPSSLSGQDVDSLFSVEMPDWLARAEPVTEESAPQATALPPAGEADSLAPVDLPSWVQAMRPVEAVISEATSSAADEPEEKEGPLAGLRGVIPGAAIGLSRRPKPVSLKLQATNEQQVSAALLEKILGSETNPRALITPSFIASQQVLRWALTGLFLVVLSAVIFFQSQTMQIYPVLPAEAEQASNAVKNLPSGAKVLVVIDYEPSLAGEMEAIGGPLLDQLTLLHNSQFSFLSTSPNGSALVERLLSNAKIDELNVQYRNLGFLPGGSTGVLGFVEAPSQIIPASQVQNFAEYAMLILMTDHAESGRIWVEQAYARKQIDPALVNQPLIVLASAQAGPLLQPYVSSRQVTGMISGLSEAVRYENNNGGRPGIAHSYWDTFGVGLMMAVALIVIGGLWSLVTGIRARRAEAEQG